MMDDRFNEENESFMQETEKKTNEYSINLPTKFFYKKKWNRGWINVVNPFRATIVLGTPGSGKSYAVVNNFIKQQIEKGFSLYVYDYKSPDLTMIAYNHMLNNKDKYGKFPPRFCFINFDDPEHSHRCNPIHPGFHDGYCRRLRVGIYHHDEFEPHMAAKAGGLLRRVANRPVRRYHLSI